MFGVRFAYLKERVNEESFLDVIFVVVWVGAAVGILEAIFVFGFIRAGVFFVGEQVAIIVELRAAVDIFEAIFVFGVFGAPIEGSEDVVIIWVKVLSGEGHAGEDPKVRGAEAVVKADAKTNRDPELASADLDT